MLKLDICITRYWSVPPYNKKGHKPLSTNDKVIELKQILLNILNILKTQTRELTQMRIACKNAGKRILHINACHGSIYTLKLLRPQTLTKRYGWSDFYAETGTLKSCSFCRSLYVLKLDICIPRHQSVLLYNKNINHWVLMKQLQN